MRIALLGLGLIGGSVARALHERDPGGWAVAAWSPSGDGPRRAVEEGTVERAASSPEAALDHADLVILAVPPLACLDLLDRVAGGGLGADAVVTDVSSTKRAIVTRAAGLGLRFVGGHPMAGRESAGYAAGDGDLFVDRPWVVCGSGPDADRVEALARATGARPIRMEPAAHDAAVAAISHLPLVVAAALVDAVAGDGATGWGEARGLAASGWRDMTRLARGDVEMAAGIAATNAEPIADHLRRLRSVLDDWLAELDRGAPDADRLRARFGDARRRLQDAD